MLFGLAAPLAFLSLTAIAFGWVCGHRSRELGLSQSPHRLLRSMRPAGVHTLLHSWRQLNSTDPRTGSPRLAEEDIAS